MNKRTKAILFGVFLLVILLVRATTFTPQGNMDLKNTYNISNVPRIQIDDSEKICWGSSGCTDSESYFNGTNLILKVS
jgi:hypothetical protein